MSKARKAFRLALGGAVCGGFLGIFVGGLLGVVVGWCLGNFSIGLDGALIGWCLCGLGGGIYGGVLAIRDIIANAATPSYRPPRPSNVENQGAASSIQPVQRGE